MKNPNIRVLPDWARPISRYVPMDAREAAEKEEMLRMIALLGDKVLVRDCTFVHMTASAMIVDRERRRTLMAFHKIYNSWAWTGGHADGETDFEATARREAREETGILDLRRLTEGIASIEILPVWAHEKRGEVVGSHLHMNVTYLFQADEDQPIRPKADENRAVAWLDIDGIEAYVSEPDMLPIYRKLFGRANNC